MKVGLIIEMSQAYRTDDIVGELKAACEKYGHEFYDFTNPTSSYAKCGLLASTMLETGVVDFMISGCGTGTGALVGLNTMPGVHCAFIQTPADATMFRELNRGNAAAFGFTRHYGNEGRLNLRYCFDKLLCPLDLLGDTYFAQDLLANSQPFNTEFDELKEKSTRPILEILKSYDADYLKETFCSETFDKVFYENCKDAEVADYLKEMLK